MGGELERVQCAASAPRLDAGMGASPMELQSKDLCRRQPEVEHGGIRPGMPVQRTVEVVEEAVPGHEDLRAFDLLRGAAVYAQRAGDALRKHLALGGDRGSGEGGAEQVVPAAVTVLNAIRALLSPRHSGVAEARQRVVLEQEADLRSAVPLTPLGDERRRQPRRGRAHEREAGGLELADVHLRRIGLLEGDLGKAPHLRGDALDRRARLSGQLGEIVR
jgi:hypothetical protein